MEEALQLQAEEVELEAYPCPYNSTSSAFYICTTTY